MKLGSGRLGCVAAVTKGVTYFSSPANEKLLPRETYACVPRWLTGGVDRCATLSVTSSAAAGFGRHGMPPPASNDTGTAFCFPNEEEAEMRRTDNVSL